MYKSNVLKQNVNFFISVAFIASFGIFMTSTVLRLAHLEDPLVDKLAASINEYQTQN